MGVIPVIDKSLCVRHRFAKATCSACSDHCPKQAISLGRGISIDSNLCTNCGLCSPACPNEAISGAADDLATAVPKLSCQDNPVLGCKQNLAGSCDARVGCFGGLSARDLVVLALATKKSLTLNIAPCKACKPGLSILPVLEERLMEIDEQAAVPESCRLKTQRHFKDEEGGYKGASRRGLFRRFLGFAKTEDCLALDDLKTRRNRTKTTAGIIDPKALNWFLQGSDFLPIKLDQCDECCRCAAVCPTEALNRTRQDGKRFLVVDPQACTGCGVCFDFCPKDAIEIQGVLGLAQY